VKSDQYAHLGLYNTAHALNALAELRIVDAVEDFAHAAIAFKRSALAMRREKYVRFRWLIIRCKLCCEWKKTKTPEELAALGFGELVYVGGFDAS
jgi:hypothetical protein